MYVAGRTDKRPADNPFFFFRPTDSYGRTDVHGPFYGLSHGLTSIACGLPSDPRGPRSLRVLKGSVACYCTVFISAC